MERQHKRTASSPHISLDATFTPVLPWIDDLLPTQKFNLLPMQTKVSRILARKPFGGSTTYCNKAPSSRRMDRSIGPGTYQPLVDGLPNGGYMPWSPRFLGEPTYLQLLPLRPVDSPKKDYRVDVTDYLPSNRIARLAAMKQQRERAQTMTKATKLRLDNARKATVSLRIARRQQKLACMNKNNRPVACGWLCLAVVSAWTRQLRAVRLSKRVTRS